MKKKQYRKLYSSKQNKAAYSPPQLGYQAEKHPLTALLLTLIQHFLKLRIQLVQFFTYCTRRAQSYPETY